MTQAPRNSMAAILTVVMTAMIWIVVVLGGCAFLTLGIGLLASLNDGALDLPVGQAAADLSPLNFVFAMVGLAVLLPGAIFVCAQLRRILATLADGDPFVPENAPRLTRIAMVLAIMELASTGFVICMRLFVPPEAAIARPGFGLNLVVWAAVAALLVLSQVFREGTRLREEEKMTI